MRCVSLIYSLQMIHLFCVGLKKVSFATFVAFLLCFEAVSGLKINLSKSEAIPIGMVGNVQDLADIMSCRASSLPITYLGLPLGDRFTSVHIWNGIIERIEKRLAEWKQSYLSKDGRGTLIKSTLANLSTYFLSLFSIPSVWLAD